MNKNKIEIGYCKDCKWRNEYGACSNSDKINDSEASVHTSMTQKDYLLYEYYEGGEFYVGENFGCVHWTDAKNKANTKESAQSKKNADLI